MDRMKGIFTMLFLSLGILLMTLLPLQAGQKKISYQGKLTDASGNPITATAPGVSVVFRLYNVPTGGTTLWEEVKGVEFNNGLFNVVLGTSTCLDNLSFTEQYYLGIQIAGDPTEMTPRQPLNASAYALGSLGDFGVKQNLNVSGNSVISGTSTVSGNLNVSGDTVILGSSTFVGNTNISTRLGVGDQYYNNALLDVCRRYNGFSNPILRVNYTWDKDDMIEVRKANTPVIWLGGGYCGATGTDVGRIYIRDGSATRVAISATHWNDTYFNAGKVGIKTAAPGYDLHVVGSAYCTTGWQGSDERIKSNVQELPAEGVKSKIMTLRPISYTLNKEEICKMRSKPGEANLTSYDLSNVDETKLSQADKVLLQQKIAEENAFFNKRLIGLNAQELEKLFPELVNTDSNGYKAVAYDRLSVILLEAVKEQQKQIEELRDELQAIKLKVQ